MVELVIKIPEEIISFVNLNGFLTENYRSVMGRVLLDGVELSKRHGDLVDRNDLSLMTVHLIDGTFVCDAPTIIDADKGE